jgi:hypothetical protein
MTDAPATMWRESIIADKMYPDGGSFYHELPTPRRATEYTRTDIAQALLVEFQIISEINSRSQARIAELEAALTRAVQIAENYATIYSEGKPDDWEDRADNMMWGMHRDIADLKAKP